MQIVEVPGVGEVEFPDTMSDADVIAAVRKLSSSPQGPQTVPSHATVPPGPPPGLIETGIRGGIQGASLGFGDEAAAAVESILPEILRNETSRQAVGGAQ